MHHRFWTCVVLALLVPGFALRAQEAAPDDREFAFWLKKDLAQPVAAAQVVGVGLDPFAAFFLRSEGLRLIVWDELGFAGEFAPELPARLLDRIRDRRERPQVVARFEDEIRPEDRAFNDARLQALSKSYWTPLDAFKKSAEESKHVTYDHLMRTPGKYRGKVIEITGTLAQVRSEDTSLEGLALGVPKQYYTGWIFSDTKNRAPICIQFPMLPEGLEPSENMRKKVTFYGYFIATFKYEAGKIEAKQKEKVILETPLLVGPAPVLAPKAGGVAEAETPFPLIVLGLVLMSLIVLSIVFFLMYYGFQRGDRKIYATLDDIKMKHAPSPFMDEKTDPETNIKASSQLILGEPPPEWLPEAKPIDPERN